MELKSGSHKPNPSFAIKNITGELTKYHHVVAALPNETQLN